MKEYLAGVVVGLCVGAAVGASAEFSFLQVRKRVKKPPPESLKSFKYRPRNAMDVHMLPYVHAINQVEKAKRSLEAELIRILTLTCPGWKNVNINQCEVKQLGGAMTNFIFLANKNEGENAKVLIRIYGEGTENFFSREDEMKLFELLSNANVGIGLLGTFENGRLEKVINGETISNADMREPKTFVKIAARMFQLHQMDLPLDKTPQLMPRIQAMFQQVKALCTGSKFKFVDFTKIAGYIEQFESLIPRYASPIVFAHNDLQYGNVMDTYDGYVTLIDYEYGGYNYRGFDIGNFFCEWMYNYASHSPHLPLVRYYPSEEHQREFAKAYLQGGDPGKEVSEAELDALCLEGNFYALGSHLFWACWGYLQAAQSTIDFNYLEYANARISCYAMSVPTFL